MGGTSNILGVQESSNDGFVSFDGVRYGVKWHYCGQVLKATFEYSGVIKTGQSDFIKTPCSD